MNLQGFLAEHVEVWREKDWAEAAGLDFFHLPWNLITPPRPDEVATALSVVWTNPPVTAYVHCHAGVSRGGMVVVAYLMWRHDWSRDKALGFVRSQREVVRPNPAFMALLREWEEALQRERMGCCGRWLALPG